MARNNPVRELDKILEQNEQLKVRINTKDQDIINVSGKLDMYKQIYNSQIEEIANYKERIENLKAQLEENKVKLYNQNDA